MPVLPFLTDTREHLDRAFRMLAEAGATSVAYSALHLKPGVKEWYLAWIERAHPEHLERTRALYAGGVYAPKEYRRWLAERIRPFMRQYGFERTRLAPGTGVPASSAHPEAAHRGSRLLATELSPRAAAALQPSLF